MMKKIYKTAFLASLIVLVLPLVVSAKTLGQLKQEYAALEEKYAAKNNQIKTNESQQSAAKARIQSIYGELAQAEKDIQALNDDIVKRNNEIAEKNTQIKDLMRFYQVSEGESTYLEYIFAADSITDFIYRVSVTEQLTTYNNKLISELEEIIKENQANIKKLHEQEDALKSLQDELRDKLVILAEEEQQLSDEEESLAKDIQYNKAIINYYIKSGCKENQDISNCANKQLPPGTKFWRPTNSGQMYSTWWSDTYSDGSCRTHAGVDIANSCGTNIYSVSSGKVVYAGYASDGYGNKVVIHHSINGQNYTTLYGHMSSIYVRVGSVVTKDTVIGTIGNTGHSFGCHLHLNVCVGLGSCVSRAGTSDPGRYINFPANKKWYNDRSTSYSGYYSNPCRY